MRNNFECFPERSEFVSSILQSASTSSIFISSHYPFAYSQIHCIAKSIRSSGFTCIWIGVTSHSWGIGFKMSVANPLPLKQLELFFLSRLSTRFSVYGRFWQYFMKHICEVRHRCWIRRSLLSVSALIHHKGVLVEVFIDCALCNDVQ